MFQRRIYRERELRKESIDCQEIVDFLKEVGLMKIVSDIGPWYEKLVNEFIVNIYDE